MLRQSEALAPLAAIAVQHRERLDGSGYPRGLSGAGISRLARILAAADAYQAMREPRPHRAARSAEEAAAELRADVRAGRYDADAVEAVLGAAGHRVPRRREGPAGLTPREVEVLRLLARGLSNKEIARAAGDLARRPSATTSSTSTRRSTPRRRAAASLFAMQHGLLPEEEFPARAVAGLSVSRPACACMFCIITASVSRSSSAGLNCTISVPGSCFTGTWPGGV